MVEMGVFGDVVNVVVSWVLDWVFDIFVSGVRVRFDCVVYRLFFSVEDLSFGVLVIEYDVGEVVVNVIVYVNYVVFFV